MDFSGKNLKLLTPAEGDHRVQLSPGGKYIIDSYSQADVPPVHEVRDTKGKLIATLEKTDISTAGGSRMETPAALYGEIRQRPVGFIWTYVYTLKP